MNLSELCSEEEHVILSQLDAGLASDWLIEHGIWPEFRTIQRKPSLFPVDVNKFFGTCVGFGVGHCSASGNGFGSGSCYGSGSGRMGPWCYEIGTGLGTWHGIGTGNFVYRHDIDRRRFGDTTDEIDVSYVTRTLQVARTIMRIGKTYLIHVGDMHTVVGRVIGMICPGVWTLEDASKVDIQNFGDRWHTLAKGENEELRLGARYWHFTGEVSIPHLLAMEWFGKLPVEFKASEQ